MKFEFENNENLECIELDGEPLFEPRSIGKCLGISKSSVSAYLSEMDVEDKVFIEKKEGISNKLRNFPSGGKTLLRESGMYLMIFKSRKPEAKAFKKWVAREVLPSIRHNGRYELQTQNETTMQLLLSMTDNLKKLTGVQPEELARVQNESYRAKLANLLNDIAKRDKVGTQALYEKLYYLFAGETGFFIPDLAKKAKINNNTYLKKHELSAKMLYEFALGYFYKDKRIVELIKLSPDQRTLGDFKA